jgi:hypothetical protein
MDPYSHTPGAGGARQPGLTGQVKEDILCRFGELGVQVRKGCIHFEPRLLDRAEFLPHPTTWNFFDVAGNERHLKLPPDSLAFTYCQTPVIYKLASQTQLAIHRKHEVVKQPGPSLDASASRAIFDRTGEITLVVLSHPFR